MTWGSNATYTKITCRFCGKMCVDDTDSGLSSHEKECEKRPINIIKKLGKKLLTRPEF